RNPISRQCRDATPARRPRGRTRWRVGVQPHVRAGNRAESAEYFQHLGTASHVFAWLPYRNACISRAKVVGRSGEIYMTAIHRRIVALAGGVGGAKLAHGLAQILPPEDL